MKTLVTAPTARSLERLERMFLNSPITIRWDSLALPLAVVPDDYAGENVSAVYSGTFKRFTSLWDDTRSRQELVGVLESPAMSARSAELGMPPDYLFKLIFLPYATTNSYAVRNFLVSIADTLVLREKEPFTFEKEYVV